MLEIYLGKKLYERFSEENESEVKNIGGVVPLLIVLLVLISIGGYSAYLSWGANSLAGWGILSKIFFSFFAFLSGISYLIAYFIYKLDLVHTIVRMTPPMVMT